MLAKLIETHSKEAFHEFIVYTKACKFWYPHPEINITQKEFQMQTNNIFVMAFLLVFERQS